MSNYLRELKDAVLRKWPNSRYVPIGQKEDQNFPVMEFIISDNPGHVIWFYTYDTSTIGVSPIVFTVPKELEIYEQKANSGVHVEAIKGIKSIQDYRVHFPGSNGLHKVGHPIKMDEVSWVEVNISLDELMDKVESDFVGFEKEMVKN